MNYPRRPIVTLLSDFGEGSYVASLKGVLLTLAPDIELVDVTHRVNPGAVGSAGFLICHTASFFPPGSIHLCIVDPGVGTLRLPIILRANDSMFIGPDNGLFGEVISKAGKAEAWEVSHGPWLPDRICPTFHGRDLFAPVAGYLARGEMPGKMGKSLRVEDLVPSPVPRPISSENEMVGQVIWVDHFGNLITNLSDVEVELWVGSDRFDAHVGWERVEKKIETFQEVEPGEMALLYGSWRTLEVVVREGSAAGRLGAAIGEPVRLERSRE